MSNNNSSVSATNKAKKMVNFELRIVDLQQLDSVCDQLDISRTQFIKDAISAHMKKYQTLSNQLEQTTNFDQLEQKIILELNEKVDKAMKKINQIPALDPSVKLKEKAQIMELLEQIPLKSTKIASISGINEEHILKILKELTDLGQVEFKDGKWRQIS